MMHHLCQAAAIFFLVTVTNAQVVTVDQAITLSAVACQGTPRYLICPLGFFIRITTVFHGRLDFSTCAAGADGSTLKICVIEDDIEGSVRQKCDGLNMCHFEAEKATTGNCSGINTYISVEYQCKWPAMEVAACEDDWLALTCPDDKVIKVDEARLGRTGSDACSNTSSNIISTCDSKPALEFAQKVCDGGQECKIKVSEGVLGSKCAGEGQLLLSTSVSCIDCENTYNDSYCEKMALKGNCQSNPNWMTIHCRKACLRCDSLDLCNNTKDDDTCHNLAGQGKCSNPLVAQNCEKSCTKCRNRNRLSTLIPPAFNMVTPTTEPPPCVNEGDEDFCHNVAVLGECESGDSILLNQKCYRSCSGCNATACEDLLELCPTLAAKGECSMNNITRKCPVSCNGTCDLADLSPERKMECVNIHHDENSCDFWAMTGECDLNAYWMRKNCYKSCTKCHVPDICQNNLDHQRCDRGAANNKCSDREFAHQCPQSCGRCQGVDSTSFEKCVNAHTSDADCTYWALLGECDINPDWMTLNCYKACKECATENTTECVNAKSDEDCDYWHSYGECTSNEQWMSIYCHKTCSYCALPDCSNRRGDVRCTHWAAIGECDLNKEWMHVNCKEACRQCDHHLNKSALCEAMWNATNGNMTDDNMTTTSMPIETTTLGTNDDSVSNMTDCEMGAAEGNCSMDEFALLCPEECYNMTCNDTGIIYKHPVLRYYDVPELNYGTTTCDGEVWIVCPPSYHINVTEADFIAEDPEFCKQRELERRLQTEWWIVEQEMKLKGKDSEPTVQGTPCQDPTILEAITSECNGRSWCHFNLSASNYTNYCPDETSRFLNISFTCKEPVYHGKACDGTRLNLLCWSYQSIQIHKATFGRLDAETCPVTGDSNLDGNKTCNNPHATALVSELCNFNQTCSFDASPVLFGDPCPGTSKYMTVDFSCIECINAYHSDYHCDYWAQVGECEKNPSWMMAYCRKSCTRCHVVDTCNNTYHDDYKCNHWASIGECKRNPNWMRENCQRSCNRCPDDYDLPTPTPRPTRPPFPNVSKDDAYDSFYMEMYLMRRWHKDFTDLQYNKTKVIHKIANETLWNFYSEAYPSKFEALSHFYFRKSTITPWVIVGFHITFNENVTMSEAVEIECAILDRDNGTLMVDKDTMLVTLNFTKKQCDKREGYCQFGSELMRKGDGTFYCRCTGQWAGDRCNDLPLWGKIILGVVGGILVIVIIVLVVRRFRERKPPVKEDKTELVDAAHVDTLSKDTNLDLKGVAEIQIEPEEVQRPVTPDLLHNRKKIPIPRLPLPKSPDADKEQLRLQENEEHGTTNL